MKRLSHFYLSAKFLLFCVVCFGLSSTVLAQSLEERINQLTRQNLFDSTFVMMDSLESEFTQQKALDSLLIIHTLKANIYFRLGKIDEMNRMIESAQSIYSEVNPESHQPRLLHLNYIGFFSLEKGEMGKAQEAYESMLHIIGGDESNNYYAQALIGLSYYYLYLANFQKGKAYAVKAYQNTKRYDNDEFLKIRINGALDYIYEYYNQLDSALIIGKENLQLIQDLFKNNHPNTANAYASLGDIHMHLLNYNEGFANYEKAISIAQEIHKSTGHTHRLATILSNFGLVYLRLGELEIARELIERSKKLCLQEMEGDNFHMLWTYIALVEIYYKLDNDMLVKYYADKAQMIIDKLDPAEQSDYRDNLLLTKATTYYNNGDYTASIRLANEVYNSISNSGTANKLLVEAANILALNSFKIQDYKAFNRYSLQHKVLADSLFPSINHNVLLACTNLLKSYAVMKDTAKTDSTILGILKTFNDGTKKYNFAHLIPNFNGMEFFNTVKDYYLIHHPRAPLYNRYFSLLEDVDKYFNSHLSAVINNDYIGRNAIELNTLYTPALNYYAVNDPGLFLQTSERLKNIQFKVGLKNKLTENAEQRQFAQQYNELITSGIDSTQEFYFHEFARVAQQFQKAKDSLLINDKPKFLTRYGIEEIDLNEISDVLEPNEALLKYLVVDSTLYIVFYDKSSVKVDSVKFDKSLRNTILRCIQSYDDHDRKELYSILIPPEAKSFERLCIVPDDILYYFNFEVLLDEDGAAMIYNHTIRYALSLSILKLQNDIHDSKKLNNNLVAFTPGFSAELKDSLNQIYLHDTTWKFFIQQPFLRKLSDGFNYYGNECFSEYNATESNFLNHRQDYNIIHFGTHGLLNDQSPLFSSLVLVKDSIEDGYLHTYEIYKETIDAKMAVLAACSSGLGALSTGDGVKSLAQAFLKAGVPSVLMTLSDVDEKATSSILESFYTHLKRGKSKSEALRAAKLEFMQNAPPEFENPYYWSGLMIIGTDSPIYNQSHLPPISTVILCLILGVILFLVFRSRNTSTVN